LSKRFYSYQNFIKDIPKIGDQVKNIDTIVGVSRGGWTFSHFLSEYLNIRQLFSISSISYNENKKLENIKIFGVPNLEKSKHVLIVDDISDSGRTLKSVVKKMKIEYPNIVFSTATIFLSKNSTEIPNFYIYKTDEWIDFFWSEDFKSSDKIK